MRTYTIFYSKENGKLGSMDYSINSISLVEALHSFESVFKGYRVGAITTPEDVTYTRVSESSLRKVQ